MTKEGLHLKVPKWTKEEKARWPNFSPTELACKGSGEYFHSPEFLDALQRLRNEFGPITITSGHRSVQHNARVGGASRSMHLTIAADIPHNGKRKELFRAAVKAGFTGIGFGNSFLHVDLREKRTGWVYSQTPGTSTLAIWAKALGINPLNLEKWETV